MKKIIACILTLCLLTTVSTTTLEAPRAAAEATQETSQTSAQETAAPAVQVEAATPAPQADSVTPQPQETVAPTETAAPTDEAAVEATPDPEASASPEETPAADEQTTEALEQAAEQDAAQPTAAPAAEADVGSGPVWIQEGAHRRYGDLEDLLPTAIINQLTITLCTTSVMEVHGYSLSELRAVGFALDTDALGEHSGLSVILSALAPNGSSRANTVYVWAGDPAKVPTPQEVLGDAVELTTDDSALLEGEIQVTATGYTPDEGCAPSFALVAIPELAQGETFAVSVDDGQPQAIAGASFTPAASGAYRFAAPSMT